MSVPAEVLRQETEQFLQRVAKLRAGPEERARLLDGGVPFDFDAWVRGAGRPVPEELLEMKELQREREEERQRSLAAERKIERTGA